MQSRVALVVPRLSSSLATEFDSQVLLQFQDSCCSPNLLSCFQAWKWGRMENICKTYLIYASSHSLIGTMALGNAGLSWTHCFLEWNVLSVSKEREQALGRQWRVSTTSILWENHPHTLLFMMYIITDILNEIWGNYIQIF